MEFVGVLSSSMYNKIYLSPWACFRAKHLIGIFYDFIFAFQCAFLSIYIVCAYFFVVICLCDIFHLEIYTHKRRSFFGCFCISWKPPSFSLWFFGGFQIYWPLSALLDEFWGVRSPWLCTLFPNTITIIGARSLGSFSNSFNCAHFPSFSFLVV